jgi:hypothetical protein
VLAGLVALGPPVEGFSEQLCHIEKEINADRQQELAAMTQALVQALRPSAPSSDQAGSGPGKTLGDVSRHNDLPVMTNTRIQGA